jgi:Tfp pilus assembly PilM family ATPase
MANHIVGLDFGTRSIKLLEIDNEREPLVESFDREALPLDREPYLPPRKGAIAPDRTAEDAGDEGDGDDPSLQSKSDDAEGDEADDENGSWVRALERLLSRHEFREETLVVSFLPEGRAFSIHEDVPFPERSKVENILPSLLEDRLPLDPGEIVYDFDVISASALRSEQENTAVVGIGRRDDIRTFLDRLEDARCNPAVLGIPELMLRYVAESAAPPSTDTFGVVDIGHRFTRVLVLQEGEPVLARSIEVGGQDVTEAVAETYDTTLEQAEHHKKESGEIVDASGARDRDALAFSDTICEALQPLVRDLRRNFQSLYAQSRVELETLYVTGGTSRIDNLDGHLESELGLSVEHLDVRSATNFGPVAREDDPLLATSLSLALQPIRDRSEDHLLDLRRGEFAFSGRSSYLQSQMLKYAAAIAALFVLFCGALFVKKLELDAKERAMKQTVEQQTKSLFGEPVYSTDELRNRAVDGSGGGGRAYVPKMSAYRVMYELMSRVPKEAGLTVDRLDVDTSRNVTQLSGTVKSPSAVERLQDNFAKLDCVGDINQSDIKVRSESEATFRLEITTNCR